MDEGGFTIDLDLWKDHRLPWGSCGALLWVPHRHTYITASSHCLGKPPKPQLAHRFL